MHRLFLLSVLSILLLSTLYIPLRDHAYGAYFIEPAQHDITRVTNVEYAHTFYGELHESPHLFEFTLTEPTSFFAEIRVPDIDEAVNDKSGLLLRVTDKGVTEVVRLPASSANWESFYQWSSGDSYRRGASYMDSLEPGTYQLEVSTPVNRGKYTLVIGKESVLRKGYVASVRDIKDIKLFFGKSAFRSIESPFIYIPGILVLFCLFGLYRVMQRRFRQ